jgi:hypothetical protein
MVWVTLSVLPHEGAALSISRHSEPLNSMLQFRGTMILEQSRLRQARQTAHPDKEFPDKVYGTRMGTVTNAHKILVGRYEGKKLL